jgi:pimeloyl-ACP methyl ester carboxylesterase
MHYRAVLEPLARAGRVLAYDPPGAGKSTKGEPALDTVEAHLAVLDRLLEAEAREPALVAGVSFGGALALALAARRPDRVRAVSAGGVPASPAGLRARLAAEVLLRGPLLRALPVSAWRRGIARFFPGPHPHVEESAAFIGRLRGSPDWAAYTASLARLGRSAARELDLEWIAPRIDRPVRLLWGELDRVAPLASARRLAARIRGARLEVIPGAGHFPNIERPDAFAAAIAELFRSA